MRRLHVTGIINWILESRSNYMFRRAPGTGSKIYVLPMTYCVYVKLEHNHHTYHKY